VVKRQIVDGALKCGYVDKTGKIVIELKFGQAQDFIDGLAVVSEQASTPNGRTKMKVINAKGEYIINEEFDNVTNIGNGLVVVGKSNNGGDDDYGLLSKSGKMIAAIGEYEDFKEPAEGLIIVRKNEAGLGVIDYAGKTIIEPQNKYTLIDKFQFGVVVIEGNKRFQHGLLDKAGNVILDPLTNKFEIVGIDGKRTFNKSKVALIKKDNKYGLLNSSGKILVEPIYSRNSGLTDDGVKLSRMDESSHLVTDKFNGQGIKQK
jgi:hypothetical protein